MPKIKESKERILIHVSDIWKRKNISGWNFRWHDVGKKGGTMRMACQIPNKGWHTYAWSFLKSQVTKSGRTLICKDKNAYDILFKMKEGGDLKGYKVDIVVPIEKQYQYYKSSLVKHKK
jgi:hypothetical protein